MIDSRTLQTFVMQAGFTLGKIDGQIGPASLSAFRLYLTNRGVKYTSWSPERFMVALNQQVITDQGYDIGKVDGLWGPRSQYGLELFQNKLRDVTPPPVAVQHMKPIWPRQKDVAAFYGRPGENQVLLDTPYSLFLDWDLSVKINRFSIHKKVAPSAEAAMKDILDHYGKDAIHELGLDQFGGCLNVRKMRGGTRWSMHSWGIAIDWDANRNSLRMNSSQAMLAKPECSAFLKAWEKQGWISLGRERNFDWMHVQAARL